MFKLHAEKNNKAQFSDTMEALRLYASTAYKIKFNSMSILFDEQEELIVSEPTGLKEVTKTDKDGVTTTIVSRFKKTIYNKRIKQ